MKVNPTHTRLVSIATTMLTAHRNTVMKANQKSIQFSEWWLKLYRLLFLLGGYMNSVSKLLSTDGYIQVNKALIKKIGLHEAIIIGELCSEYNYWEEQDKLIDDMFYSTRENIENNTGLTEHYQRKAIAKLKELGILEVTKKGLPAVNYYKIIFNKLLEILTSSSSQDKELETKDIDLNNNKQTNIRNKKNNSKELLQKQNFQFGKQKAKKQNMFAKCVSLMDSYQFVCYGNIRSLLVDYLNFRISVRDKPLYVNMWKGMLTKLSELSDNDMTLCERIIKQSIERGYLSFYPIKQFNNTQKPWEEGVRSSRYTDEELEELAELEKQREEMGLRTKF